MEVGEVESQDLKRLTYLEKVFADLLVAHGPDHYKGRTLYAKHWESVSNAALATCKIFTDLCPCCIQQHQRNKPTAGLRPIITNGFNVWGWLTFRVCLMASFVFCWIISIMELNFFSAFQLFGRVHRVLPLHYFKFQIFTIIGPPMILQSDNGSEFHGAALNDRWVFVLALVLPQRLITPLITYCSCYFFIPTIIAYCPSVKAGVWILHLSQTKTWQTLLLKLGSYGQSATWFVVSLGILSPTEGLRGSIGLCTRQSWEHGCTTQDQGDGQLVADCDVEVKYSDPLHVG